MTLTFIQLYETKETTSLETCDLTCRVRLEVFCINLMVNKSHERTKTNYVLILSNFLTLSVAQAH